MAARSRHNINKKTSHRQMKPTFVSCRVTQKNIRESRELTKTLQKFEQEKQGSIRKIDEDLERIKEFKRDLTLSFPYEEEKQWLPEQLGQSDILLSKQRNINKIHASLVQAWDPMNQQSTPTNKSFYDPPNDSRLRKAKDATLLQKLEDISLEDNPELYTTAQRLFTPKTLLDYKDLFGIHGAKDNENRDMVVTASKLSTNGIARTSPLLTRKLLPHTQKANFISVDSAALISPQTHRAKDKTYSHNKQTRNTKEKDKQTEHIVENTLEQRVSHRPPGCLTNIRPFLPENPVKNKKTIPLARTLSDDDAKGNRRRGPQLMRRRSTVPVLTTSFNSTAVMDTNVSFYNMRSDKTLSRTDKESTPRRRTMSTTEIPPTPRLDLPRTSPIRKQSLTYSGLPW